MGYCKDCKQGQEYKQGIYCNYYKRLYDEYDGCKVHYEPRYTSGGGCFITTACVDAMGKIDGCYELQTLRKFRDEFMTQSTETFYAIYEYYEVAPRIVDAISKCEYKNLIYKEIYNNLILKTVELIENKQNHEAYILYRDYINSLKEKYLI